MALIRWNPRRESWDPAESLAEIREEMNRLLERAFPRRGNSGLYGEFAPAVDVMDEKGSLVAIGRATYAMP